MDLSATECNKTRLTLQASRVCPPVASDTPVGAALRQPSLMLDPWTEVWSKAKVRRAVMSDMPATEC